MKWHGDIMSNNRINTKEMWNGFWGCGCLTVLVGIFFPPSLGLFIPALIIYLIVAIIRSPFSLRTEYKGKKVAKKFEDAINRDAPELLEELDD